MWTRGGIAIRNNHFAQTKVMSMPLRTPPWMKKQSKAYFPPLTGGGKEARGHSLAYGIYVEVLHGLQLRVYFKQLFHQRHRLP